MNRCWNCRSVHFLPAPSGCEVGTRWRRLVCAALESLDAGEANTGQHRAQQLHQWRQIVQHVCDTLAKLSMHSATRIARWSRFVRLGMALAVDTERRGLVLAFLLAPAVFRPPSRPWLQ